MAVRILFLITDLDLGGSPLMLRGLVLQLRRIGDFDPVVVSLAPLGAVGRMMQADGIEVHSLEALGMRDAWPVLRRWRQLLACIQPRLVLSILVHANMLATLGRLFFEGPRPVYLQSIHTLQREPRWHWWLQGLISRWADGLITPAPEILRRIECYGTFERGKVIANGIDLDRFANAQPIAPTSLPFDPHRRIVGYIGRFDRVKRLDVLLEAVGKIRISNPLLYRDLQLVLVGYGKEEKNLRAQMLKWGISEHVTIAGPSSVPEKWYKSFTCYCLPSDAEGFGLTLVEALAAGVPVIAARTPVSERILQNEGRLVPAGDAQRLSVAIQEVISTRRENTVLGLFSNALLEAFSEANMAQHYNNYFQKILKL